MKAHEQATDSDRKRLAWLARRVADIARSDINRERVEVCRTLGRLKANRPVIYVDPETSWQELVPPATMQCSSPLLRAWEMQLARRIYQFEKIGDDTPVEDFLNVTWTMDWGDWGVPLQTHRSETMGSFAIDPPFSDLARDLPRLRHREFRLDREATEAQLALARELVGEHLVVRPWNGTFWMGSLPAVQMLGLEGFLFAMYDQPGELHALMRFLSDDFGAFLTAMEQAGALCASSGGVKAGSGGLGYTDELPSDDPRDPTYRRPLAARDTWGFGESQETVGVAPEMFREFVLDYQAPVLRRCGLLAYGCCEPTHDRLDLIMRALPNLRRVAVSPWADPSVVADLVGRRYIFSRKPNPAPLCVGFDEDTLRRDLCETRRVAEGLNLEVTMKDVHTLQGDTSRLPRWVKLAREELSA